ncbi:hypothetical protein SLS56_002340 [Neofusicoccum ribis]|uniref:Cupin type-2 domain-containing protein n=1 Tax=Neofusicoccum ribis TaxID=45134 RepID=A0ABR3T452_9PEZI
MVLAGAVKVIKSETLKASGAQTEGMIRMNAITNMSDQLCGTHTIVYCVSGHGTVVSDNGQTRQALAPGDFALIPAFAQHQEVNDGDTDCVWVITRGGRNPIVVNLDGWGQELRRKSDASRRGSEGSTSTGPGSPGMGRRL